MKVKRFFVPSNLDLEPLRKLGRAEYFEKLLFFISTVIYRHAVDRRYLAQDCIPLKGKILGDFMGRRVYVARVRADLIRLGVIECDFTRVYGAKCYGYRLAGAYRESKVKTVAAQYYKEQEQEVREMSKPEAYIRQNLERVTIEPAALEKVEKDYVESVDRYNCAFVSCHFIQDENWFFSTDRKTGRVYHNVANLNRDLRPFLRLDGKPLVEVDISNSQPMLLHTLYKADSAEARRYKALVESGKFYEVFQAMTGYSREEAKSGFLSFAFGEIRFAESGKFGRAFSETFPELRKIMDEMKGRDFRKLCEHLTKLEADLIIKTVVPICASRGIPLLTIHDSLMILPEHAEEVRAMIKTECERLYNLAPLLKTKGIEPLALLEAA